MLARGVPANAARRLVARKLGCPGGAYGGLEAAAKQRPPQGVGILVVCEGFPRDRCRRHLDDLPDVSSDQRALPWLVHTPCVEVANG